jgi:accessory colonization factor AcfC
MDHGFRSNTRPEGVWEERIDKVEIVSMVIQREDRIIIFLEKSG